jgi:Amidohydrolase.
MIGHWPYRKLYKNTFDDLKKVHRDNNISSGYVSSIDSIFYNDPFEGDEELHEILKGSNYHHVLTINPMLPDFIGDIEKGIKLFDIRGVKIYPCYHGYELDDSKIDILCSVLKKWKLPLFIVLSMEDERLNYLAKTSKVSEAAISKFICKNKDVKIVLLNAGIFQLSELQSSINGSDNVFFDTSGLKGPLFPIEKLLQVFDVKRILYGSMHPLYCLKSTLFLVEKAEIEEPVKEKIMCENSSLLNK